MSNTYTKLMEEVRDLGRLGSVAQMLEWDQETYIPKKGVRARSELPALTAGIAHERLVCDKMRGLIEGASAVAAITSHTGGLPPWEVRVAMMASGSPPHDRLSSVHVHPAQAITELLLQHAQSSSYDSCQIDVAEEPRAPSSSPPCSKDMGHPTVALR